MTSLYAALRDSPAEIAQLDAPNVRRVRYGNARIEVHSEEEVSLVMMLSERHRAVRRAEGRSMVGEPRIGAVTIVPPGCPTTFHVEGAATVLVLDLVLSDLGRWAAEDHELDPARIEVEPRLVYFDSVIARLFCLAAASGQNEDVLRAIGCRLLEQHSSGAKIEHGRAAGSLPPARLRRVCEKIESELEQPLGIGELAAEAGMSAFHFAREFHRATGFAPHQYVLQRRLARAVELLADPARSITQVAAAVGFAHPSHLARRLRGFTGLAPGLLRSRVLGA